MRYLPSSHFIPYAPKNTGEEVSINHTECPAGEDTRSRLYIRRLPDNRIVGYCHNCGMGGSAKAGIRPVHRRSERPSKASDREGVYLPPDLVLKTSLWPSHAVSWPLKYGITRSDLEKYRLGYSPRLDRVVIPVYNSEWDLLGYQTRRLSGTDPLPKYLSRKPRGQSLVFRTSEAGGNSIVCLVEDALSAIKVSKVAGVDGLACLGTHVSKEQLAVLCKQYTTIVIFLDNDNAQVKKKQRQLFQQCSLLFEGVKVVHGSKDPKEHTVPELKELLYD